MFLAAQEGQLEVCRWLFEHGAEGDVCTVSNNEWTPLFMACRRGHLAVCQFLFEHGAGADLARPTDNGWTPMWVAMAKRQSHVQRWLLRIGGAVLLEDDQVQRDLRPDVRADLVAWLRHELALPDHTPKTSLTTALAMLETAGT